MDKLSFYHQKRRDGGLRTGVSFNDERVLEQYEPGGPENDSVLLWFVDIRCQGEGLPSEPESVRRWFLEKSGPISRGLQELSAELIAGMDNEWPAKKMIPDTDGVEMTIYCSANRRLSEEEISAVLSSLGKAWPNLLRSLPNCLDTISSNG